jgi:three-Cys-motif partner protein
MVATEDFFNKKKDWSLLKDSIIDNYLAPYIRKILYARRPVFIIDCFAGKGKFDDGNPGSPLIIATHIKNIMNSDAEYKNIQGLFIEKKYYDELYKNLIGYKNCNAFKGTFEESIEQILQIKKRDISLFLYIDPYGIKNLNFNNFKKLAEKNFYSNELLMNFNSFGFLREGARLLKYKINDFEVNKDEADEKNTILNMNKIAGGDYWQDILKRKNEDKITMIKAEELFVNNYSEKIGDIYRYTVNVPIKKKSDHLPKYRLIFGTNHFDGLILMVNEMNKAWKRILEDERGGQRILFEEFNFPDMTIIKNFNIKNDIMRLLNQKTEIIYNDLLIKLIKKYGISYTEKEYRDKIKCFEKEGKIFIRRDPEFTKIGKKAQSWNYKKYKIYLKLK